MTRPARLKKILLFGIALLLPFFAFLLFDRLYPLPDMHADPARIILAQDGTPLWRFADAQGIWRYPVRMEEVSPLYVQALLAYEDRWFYRHPGINPFALARAAWMNWRSGRILSGGSTISMQVARLLVPHERSWQGKLQQMLRTLQLEWHYPKKQILEIYLNRAPFGGTLEGVAAASWAYLAKPPARVTAAEAALLAVLPQAPSRLRPDRYPQRAREARNKVLQRLRQQNVWPARQISEAMEEDIWLTTRREPALAPLLARRLLQHHKTDPLITSTLDSGLQQRLESLLLGWKNRLPPRVSAAILVVDSRSMEVRAYLGSADLQDAARAGHVDMVQAVRSPGSTLKPLLYALALDDGLIHSESLLQDIPRQHARYQPGNFSQGFSGPVSASEALIHSLNVPAVQLLELYGARRFAARLEQAGIRLRFPGNEVPGLALILGGTGISLEQLVMAYAALARDGTTAPLRMHMDETLQTRYLFSPGAAWIVQRILAGQAHPHSSTQHRLAGFAWKTGTSHGYRDAWAIGTGNGHVIGVWLGRPDGTPVPGQYGQVSAVPLLMQVHQRLPHQSVLPVPQPAGVGVASICWPGGQPLPEGDDNCRRQRFAWTLDGQTPATPAMPGVQQQIWQTFWLNDAGRQLAPTCDSARRTERALWPASLEAWLPAGERRARRLPPMDDTCPPARPAEGDGLRITGVSHGTRLQLPAGSDASTLELEFHAEAALGGIWWYLNGEPLGPTGTATSLRQHFADKGRQQISIMDGTGRTAMVEFDIVEPIRYPDKEK